MTATTTTTSMRSVRIGLGVLSVGVGLAALRYALPSAPGVPADVAANAHYALLPAHAVAGAAALLIGPFQFLGGRRSPRPRWHKMSGRVYAVACLFAAALGLPLALGSSAGPVASLGFGLLAVAWFATTALGWRAAMERRFEEHRRWMIRSYALSFAAVTLRLYLPISMAAHIDFAVAYPAISFLAWIPNLIVTETLLLRPARRRAPAPAAS